MQLWKVNFKITHKTTLKQVVGYVTHVYNHKITIYFFLLSGNPFTLIALITLLI